MTTRTPAPAVDEIANSPSAAYVDRVGLATYVREYRNGWKSGSSGATSRTWETASGTPAWDDGFLDARTGRTMWHLPRCSEHESNGCGEA